MLDVLRFILRCVAQIISMLFSIDIGFTSLGTFLCIIFIFLPLLLIFINMLKLKMKGD